MKYLYLLCFVSCISPSAPNNANLVYTGTDGTYRADTELPYYDQAPIPVTLTVLRNEPNDFIAMRNFGGNPDTIQIKYGYFYYGKVTGFHASKYVTDHLIILKDSAFAYGDSDRKLTEIIRVTR